MSGTVVLGADDQTPALLRAAVHRLDDVDELLLVLENPVELVVVAGAEIAHHVLVAEEEHDGAGVVELVHGVEVGHLVDVAEVDGGEILDLVGDFEEDLVLAHAVLDGGREYQRYVVCKGRVCVLSYRVVVAAEADDDEAFALWLMS